MQFLKQWVLASDHFINKFCIVSLIFSIMCSEYNKSLGGYCSSYSKIRTAVLYQCCFPRYLRGGKMIQDACKTTRRCLWMIPDKLHQLLQLLLLCQPLNWQQGISVDLSQITHMLFCFSKTSSVKFVNVLLFTEGIMQLCILIPRENGPVWKILHVIQLVKVTTEILKFALS